MGMTSKEYHEGYQQGFKDAKADYENRLKADMVAMLTEIDMELDELTPPEFSTNYYSHGIIDAQVIIQKKIDALMEGLT